MQGQHTTRPSTQNPFSPPLQPETLSLRPSSSVQHRPQLQGPLLSFLRPVCNLLWHRRPRSTYDYGFQATQVSQPTQDYLFQGYPLPMALSPTALSDLVVLSIVGEFTQVFLALAFPSFPKESSFGSYTIHVCGSLFHFRHSLQRPSSLLLTPVISPNILPQSTTSSALFLVTTCPHTTGLRWFQGRYQYNVGATLTNI